jgi:3-oxoacyl-[acyl-carrier protein] reductase
MTAGNVTEGRVAIITGVSRRAGIGFAVAQQMLADGYRVLIHSWSPHDAGRLPRPRRPHACDRQAIDAFGAIDVLVANHAHSSQQSLETTTAAELDRAWTINARAVVLLVQAFADHHDPGRADGRVVLFTAGQHLGPMADELPYAISKGAVHQMTRSLADALADRGITVNTINPGPVETGWPSDELRESLRAAFPAGRWGQPHDIASIVRLLVSRDSAWMSGQIIDAEGGFRRS